MIKKPSDPCEFGEPAGKRSRASVACAKFYTIVHVAEMLDVSVRTVRRWIGNGELAVYRFGAAVRVAEVDLRTFLALHRDD